MRSRVALLVAFAALLALPATAVGGPARASANNQTFPDSIGEDPMAPDITSIVLSNDDAGNITFQINISNRPALTPDMLVLMYLDTDQNANTGDPDTGAEYALQLVQGQVGLFQWNGSDFLPAEQQSSLTFQYLSTGPVIHVSAADLGKTKAFDFAVVAVSGIAVDAMGNADFTNAHSDAAPDPGHGFFSYQVLTKLILKSVAFTIAPRPARAGRPFSVSLAASENDTGGPVTSGTVACVASVAGKRLVATRHVVANGVASCIWRIPATDKGRLIRGSLTLNVRGVTISRPFSARVAP